jgi:hypothetical protein
MRQPASGNSDVFDECLAGQDHVGFSHRAPLLAELRWGQTGTKPPPRAMGFGDPGTPALPCSLQWPYSRPC